jgi:hypothetical protein
MFKKAAAFADKPLAVGGGLANLSDSSRPKFF